ncbi:MaoC family dehydratase [Longimycelium tulufanense]|uniref:MaoC family dehydratase n=1 Tax=Longimycelium tulufanense TaxID=907463 RepID=UPI00166EF040|nr:MaoC family dehydratase [Longimycelium tulufanense]
MATVAYEDLSPGRVIDLGRTVVDRDEMLAFARRFDPQPFHLDEDTPADSVLGGLCASGWFTASLWMRAYVDHLLADSTSLGSPGGKELSWLAPVRAGDELRFQLEVLSARRSRSRPEMGLVEMTGTAYRMTEDGGEQCVLRFTYTGLFGVAGKDSEESS